MEEELKKQLIKTSKRFGILFGIILTGTIILMSRDSDSYFIENFSLVYTSIFLGVIVFIALLIGLGIDIISFRARNQNHHSPFSNQLIPLSFSR